MTVVQIGDAIAEMVAPIVDFWGVDNLSLPGKTFVIPGSDAMWCELEIVHNDGYQATLATAAGKRRWQREGTGTVSMYVPRKDIDVRAAYNDADAIMQLYQGKRTESDVWFRRVRVEEGNNTTWFELTVIFEFEYQQLA